MSKVIINILFFSALFNSCSNDNINTKQQLSTSEETVKIFNFIKDGFVPDERTAVKVAEAILPPVYGENVLKQKPFVAKLVGDTVWVVEGTLLKGQKGGVAYIEIRKKDCMILKVMHGK